MYHFAVDERRDAAECLEMILNKISPQAAEVSTSKKLFWYCEETNENDVWWKTLLCKGLQGKDDSHH